MRLARYAALISISCLSCVGARAQGTLNCVSSQKLACLVPFTTNTAASTSAQTQAEISEASIFNAAIGAQISQLPVATSAPGPGYLYVKGDLKPFENLGPILLDRPDTVGNKKLVLGFSFQSFIFNHLDGIGVGSIPFVFSNPNLSIPANTDYFQQNVAVGIKYKQYVALATYGLAKNLDVSVVVPFARVSIGGFNTTAIQYEVSPPDTVTGPSTVSPRSAKGSASGVGDVLANVKYELWRGGDTGRVSVATGTTFRFPTGDAQNYLGSGAYGFNLYGLVSYKRRFSPHAKVAYQWNTNSILISPAEGNALPGNFINSSGNQRLPGGTQYGVGLDAGVSKRLTFSGDMLANEFVNSPGISLGQQELPATSVGPANSSLSQCQQTVGKPVVAPCYLNTIGISRNTYTTANLSLGLKLRPFRNKPLILYGNVLIQLNDVGLRSDPSPSVGISYTFHDK
jgi:hypothetical protein